MILARFTRNDDKLTRLLWLYEGYSLMMDKVGYFNPIWEVYNKKRQRFFNEITTKYKRKEYV